MLICLLDSAIHRYRNRPQYRAEAAIHTLWDSPIGVMCLSELQGRITTHGEIPADIDTRLSARGRVMTALEWSCSV